MIDAKRTAEKCVNQILEHGLAWSTFREQFPEAYEELLKYKQDIVSDIEKVILKEQGK